jgi:hypothetical protein
MSGMFVEILGLILEAIHRYQVDRRAQKKSQVCGDLCYDLSDCSPYRFGMVDLISCFAISFFRESVHPAGLFKALENAHSPDPQVDILPVLFAEKESEKERERGVREKTPTEAGHFQCQCTHL